MNMELVILLIMTVVVCGVWVTLLRSCIGTLNGLQRTPVTGTVISADWVRKYDRDERGTRTWVELHEVIEFTTAEGERITGEPSQRNTTKVSREGQMVDVYYNPENPSEFVAPLPGKEGKAKFNEIAGVVAFGGIAVMMCIVSYATVQNETAWGRAHLPHVVEFDRMAMTTTS